MHTRRTNARIGGDCGRRGFLLVLRLVLLAAFISGGEARAQLAITEVMSATRANTNTSFRGPEYWELTNFGTNDVALQGYGFRDSVPTRPLVRDLFTNLVIHASESLIFFRVEDGQQFVQNTAQFRAWWGESKLPAGLQCRTWRSPGLSGWDGDEVWLFDASGNVVDQVRFGRARLGRAFTYEPETGLFGIFSTAGADGAITAELSNDVGSPGTTTGSVLLRFLRQPEDQSADVGMTVSFAGLGAGLPRPRYQWLARGAFVAGGTSATLVLSNVQPGDAGSYQVWISNGLSAAYSAVAALTVNTDPAAPTVLSPPADVTVFSGQTAVFSVAARGLPAPEYQWQANGIDLANAIGPSLELMDVSQSMSGVRYSVRISNALGATNVAAWLTVSARPDLRFTEVMALPANEEDNRHFDWFELTNFDSNAVNLLGWRFSDHSAFARAYTITNDLTLQPGESVVCAERLDARLFAAWWGAANLPPGLNLITYHSFGLGALGDALFVWNPAATDPYDYVATASWAAATPGVSFECEHSCEVDGCQDEAVLESLPGWRGAFHAVDGGDIGSPGYVANPPPRILSASRGDAAELTVRCRVIPGRVYRLWRAPSLEAAWAQVETKTALSSVVTLTDSSAAGGSNWFYRLEELR